jgi:hypothetical protein
MGKGKRPDNQQRMIAKFEVRVRRGRDSPKYLEYLAWMVVWLREASLPQWLPQKDIYRLANRAWLDHRSEVRQAEKGAVKGSMLTLLL